MKHFVILLAICAVASATFGPFGFKSFRRRWSRKQADDFVDDTCGKLENHFRGRKMKPRDVIKECQRFQNKHGTPSFGVFFNWFPKFFFKSFSSNSFPTGIKDRDFDVTVITKYAQDCENRGQEEIPGEDLVNECIRPELQKAAYDY